MPAGTTHAHATRHEAACVAVRALQLGARSARCPMPNTRPLTSACLAALCSLALHAPETAHAQCDPKLFSDHATDPNFFWSDLDCSVDKGLDDHFAAVVPKVVVAGY